ncbi:MAG: hypothetical protein HY390_07295 [Deltaproteobacteria bacterium]|nr:hypothetical protein [Deltaproteobacteria bacterium]
MGEVLRILFKKLRPFFLFVSLTLLPFFGFAETVLAPKVCVVSLLHPLLTRPTIHEDIQKDAHQLLESMGYDSTQRLFDYKTEPRHIAECLEGDYEDVIIIFESEPRGQQVGMLYGVEEDGKAHWELVSPRIFDRRKIKKTLRQITLIGCITEEFLDSYRNLKNLAKKQGVLIKFQPENYFISGVLGREGLREEGLFGAMIAESAQDETSNTIYCLLRTHLYFAYEYGHTSCLRNHYHVALHAPVSVGLKTSTKWVKVNVDRKQCADSADGALLDVELGFFRGVNVNVSRQPLDFTKESFGASISLVQYFSIYKNP